MAEEKVELSDQVIELGLEYCEFCHQNYPVRAQVVSHIDAGVHLQISGFHIHVGMSEEPIELPPRLIRIDDIESYQEISSLLDSEVARLAKVIQEREQQSQEDPELEICAQCGGVVTPPDEAA